MIGRIYFLTLSFILLRFSVPAQERAPYEYYSFPNVQANEVIKGIWKDTTGYIWLATDLGLIAYNGQETSIYSKGLSSLYSKKLFELEDSRLVVVNDSGIQSVIRYTDSVYFEPAIYKGVNLVESIFYPKSVFMDSKEVLWVGESNAIVRIEDKEEERFLLGNNYNYHRSFSFAEDAFGNIWAASFSGQFLSWNAKSNNFDSIDIPMKEYTGIATFKGDNLVIGGNDGIVVVRVDSDKHIELVATHTEIKGVSIVKRVNDLILIGTWDSGLYYFKFDEGLSGIKKFEGPEFNDIVDLYYDETNDEIWIAGSENMGLLKKTPFTPFGETGKYRIESFVYDDDKSLYFTTGEELYFQQGRDKEKELVKLAEDYFFTAIHLQDEDLWIGDHLGRLFQYSTATNRIEEIYAAGIDFNFINQITTINESIWVTSSLTNVIEVDNTGTVRHLEDAYANIIRQAPSGEIYIAGGGLENILSKYNPTTRQFEKQKIDIRYSISENMRVEDIAFSESQIFLASNEGVLIVESQDGNYYSDSRVTFGETGTANYSCRALAYIDGGLWIGTNEGIFYSEGDWSVHFSTASGLPSRLIRHRGFYYDGQELTVATAKGMAILNPSSIQTHKTPKPVIESFIIGDQARFTENDLANIPNQSNLEISFRSFTYPGYEIQYRTRILGISEDWNIPSGNQIISLFGVGRGNYTLEVEAKSVGQIWSDPVRLNFRVLSPWYMRWWAVLLFVMVAFGIVVISIRVYHYNLINQKQRLQKLVAQATEEIEKHKNEIIDQQNHIIEQKEELLDKNEAVFKARQALTDADLKYLQLKENQLKDQVEYRNKQITTHTLNIIQKNETLLHLKEQLEKVSKSVDKASNAEIRKTIRFIDESFKQDKDWEDFKLYFEQIYTGFYAKLTATCPELTSHDLRHCALIRLNLSNQECASILGISPESIKVSRARIRKKIKTDPGKGLTEFILSV
ncbi:MAG: triple tyrosine motif-containing protein [Cyclobacteriaceae bacterium]